MDDLGTLLHAYGGSLERHELLDLGWSDRAIQRALRDGDLVRIRFGTYAHGPTWQGSTPEERHRVLVRGVLGKLGRHTYASHHSAAALHGFDLWDVDLTEVQVGRLDGRTGRLDAGVRFHRGAIDPDSLIEIDGLLVTPPARAVVETALGGSLETGAVTASSALRQRSVTPEELAEVVQRFAPWAGSIEAHRAVSTADALLESVGEVRSMCMFRRFAIPRPELQHEFFDDGRLLARSDFWWWRHRHVGEFDGLVKYGRLNPYATDVGRVLVDEKRREDAVRGVHQLGMSRWTWADLDPRRVATTAGRLKADLTRSRRIMPRVVDLGA